MLPLVLLRLATVTYANELGGILCRQPKNEGYECGVTSPYAAYHFDVDIGECIEFMFQGCGGNQNRFPTKKDCMDGCRSLTLCGKGMPLMDFAGNIKRCDGERVPCPGSHHCVGQGMNSVCCQKADRICQSSVHAGSTCGVPAMTRYYFDFSSKTCRSFAFTGCGGNENNFKTKGECMQFCSSEIICPRGDPHPDRYSINQIASCMEDKHCPRNYTCTARSGRKGACCPSKDFVCGTPFEIRNPCRRPISEKVWSFDYKKGECTKMEHPSCDEQWNAFANAEQCVDYCIGACPRGLDQHFNPLTGHPQLCDAKRNTGCPLGYECVKSSPFAAICCKTAPLCPAAESIVLIEDNEAVRCIPNREDSCPDQYSCQQAKNMEHICCTRPLSCPSGMKTMREDGGRPRMCTVGVEGNCPKDHMCVLGEGSVSGGARHLCCRPERKCLLPFVDLEMKRPKRCFPGDATCPASTSCLPALEENSPVTNAIDVMFFCCHTVDVFTCSDGSQPIIDRNTKRPMSCAPSNPMSCPSEMSCSALMDGSHACCPHPLASVTCTEAIIDENGPVECKGFADNSCSEGKCRKAVNGRHYCCRTTHDAAHFPPRPNLAPPLNSVSYQTRQIPVAQSSYLSTADFRAHPGILYVPDLRLNQYGSSAAVQYSPSITLPSHFPRSSWRKFRHFDDSRRPSYLRGVKRIPLRSP